MHMAFVMTKSAFKKKYIRATNKNLRTIIPDGKEKMQNMKSSKTLPMNTCCRELFLTEESSKKVSFPLGVNKDHGSFIT